MGAHTFGRIQWLGGSEYVHVDANVSGKLYSWNGAIRYVVHCRQQVMWQLTELVHSLAAIRLLGQKDQKHGMLPVYDCFYQKLGL